MANLSIHGRDRKTGQQHGERYNTAPQEPKLPSTARGLRRLAKKKGKKAAYTVIELLVAMFAAVVGLGILSLFILVVLG
jgi:hypothetical protein